VILLRDGLLTGPLVVPLVTQRFRTRGWDNEGGLDKRGRRVLPQLDSAATLLPVLTAIIASRVRSFKPRLQFPH
jgi:hypothetical protein